MCACGLVSLFFMPGLSPHCAHCTQNTQLTLTPAHQTHSTHYSFSPIFPLSPDFFSPCHSLPSNLSSLIVCSSGCWYMIEEDNYEKNGGVWVWFRAGLPCVSAGGKVNPGMCMAETQSDHTLTDTHALCSVCGVVLTKYMMMVTAVIQNVLLMNMAVAMIMTIMGLMIITVDR